MSEISVLSSQYNKLVTASNLLNEAVVAFKKRRLLSSQENKAKYPKLAISVEQISSAKADVLPFLEDLYNWFSGKIERSENIPSAVMDDYKLRLSAIDDFEKQLSAIIATLKNDNPLRAKDLQLLDTIVSTLDFERTVLFRKLRTGRA
jgi:hypothetical protein